MDAETFSSVDLRNSPGQYQIVFRILCSGDRIGQVIGNSGTIIRALESESGAHKSVAPSLFGCDERLITITSMESPESPISPAHNAVILVFNRSVEAGYENGLDSPSSGTPISARLVIQPYQMGCLLGKHGSIMSDMRKVTGAYIKIIGGHKVSRCASETDQVVLGGDGNLMNHFKGGIELGWGSRSAIITNTTVEIMVPLNVISSVYGENESNLARLRQLMKLVRIDRPHCLSYLVFLIKPSRLKASYKHSYSQTSIDEVYECFE